MTSPPPDGSAAPVLTPSDGPSAPASSPAPGSSGGARVLVLAVVAAVLTFGVGIGMRGAVTAHPKRWDDKVLPVVRFVEEATGRPFRHAVKVTFLDEASFVERVKRENRPSAQDVKENPWRSASLRALGLAEGKLDLLAATRSAIGQGVYGFYDPKKVEMVIRGDRMTGTVRSTLAHELTHAWQDQWYGLDRKFASSEASAGWTSLVEGHATYVGELYKAKVLNAAEQDEAQTLATDVSGDLAELPDVVVSSLTFPYQFGLGYVLSLSKDQAFGSVRPSPETVTAIDRAFADPPTSTRTVVGLASPRPVRDVPTPALRTGERWLDDDMLGAQGLFLAVDERLGYSAARAAVIDWGGDSTVFLARGSTVCLRSDVVGVDAAATGRLGATMRRWAAAMPAASVRLVDGRVRVDSCDPGVAAKFSARPHTMVGSTVLAIEQLLALQNRRIGGGERVAAVTGKAVVCALASDPADEEELLTATVAVLPQLVSGATDTCPKVP